MTRLRVIHLVGSPTSTFFFELSRLYATDVVQPVDTVSQFVQVDPRGRWSVGPSLNELEAVGGVRDMLATVRPADIVVPHTLCERGLTGLRAFFSDVLQLPLVGSSPRVHEVALDKRWTRATATAVGVTIAPGEVLFEEREPSLPLPYVVKPVRADNSDGLSLVRSIVEIPGALHRALGFGCAALVEAFVPGREIRVGVLQTSAGCRVLPMIEYSLSETLPIRVREDKLDASAGRLRPSRHSESAVIPALLAPGLRARLEDAALRMHRGLEARDFSLYDFRCPGDDEEPILLEAGLYWSFGPASMISRMLRSEGASLPTIAGEVWRQAAARHPLKAERMDAA